MSVFWEYSWLNHDFSRTVPAVVVNEYGKGKGVYLNLSLDGYPMLRKSEGGGRDTRELRISLLPFLQTRTAMYGDCMEKYMRF